MLTVVALCDRLSFGVKVVVVAQLSGSFLIGMTCKVGDILWSGVDDKEDGTISDETEEEVSSSSDLVGLDGRLTGGGGVTC